MKNKVIGGLIVVLIMVMAAWFAWNYMIPSQDIKKGIKDMRADAVGLPRIITHTLFDGSKKSWDCKTKIYPFPSEGSGGASFSFIDNEGKKVICGPGWRIEEN